MQCGNVVPSPTMSEMPQAFAPRMYALQRLVHGAKLVVPVSWSYALAMTTRPAPCDVVSQVAHGKPNWNGSVPACARAPPSCFFRSPRSADCEVSSPDGL